MPLSGLFVRVLVVANPYNMNTLTCTQTPPCIALPYTDQLPLDVIIVQRSETLLTLVIVILDIHAVSVVLALQHSLESHMYFNLLKDP